MIRLRSLAFDLAATLWTLLLGIAALPVLLLFPMRIAGVADLWTGGMLWLARVLCGIRHRVIGAHHRSDAAIYAAKHQSAWETLALWRLLDRPVFVLKQELLSIPVFGTYLSRVPHIAIDRSSGSTAIKQLVAQSRMHLASGRCIVIFPEGTRTLPGERVKYKNGIVTLYRQLGATVIPVALDSGVYWGKKAKRPGCITLAFEEPLPLGLTKDAFRATLEQRIEETSERLLHSDNRIIE